MRPHATLEAMSEPSRPEERDEREDEAAPAIVFPKLSSTASGSPARKVALLGALLAAAGGIVALVLTSFGDATVYSKGVDQLLAEKSRWVGRTVRVEGTLVKGTLVFREKPCEYRFDVTRSSALLHVRYPSCTKPDTLRDDMPEVGVTAEGKLQNEGDFLASNVLAKCPSKYEMKEKAKNGLPPGYTPPNSPSALPAGPPAAIP